MSTKLAAGFYVSCNATSDGKTGNSSLLPTIKRSKMIHQTPHFLKFTAQYGNSMVISKPGKIQVKASASPNTTSSSWKKWLLGILVTLFLTAVGYKAAQFLYLKSKIEKAVKTAEHAVEVVEEVAEEAEKMVVELKNFQVKTVGSFDLLAKRAANEAKKAEDAVHKVKEMEEELETLKKAAEDQPKK